MTKGAILGIDTEQMDKQTEMRKPWCLRGICSEQARRDRGYRWPCWHPTITAYYGYRISPALPTLSNFLVMKEKDSHHHKGQSGRKKKKVTLHSLRRQLISSWYMSLKSFFFLFYILEGSTWKDLYKVRFVHLYPALMKPALGCEYSSE